MAILKISSDAPTLKELIKKKYFIFDLDNTLYSSQDQLWCRVEKNMGLYISRLLDIPQDQAHVIQKKYFHDYGSTLDGLIKHHQIDPQDYLKSVHDIDLCFLQQNKRLDHILSKIPAEKFIFTNAPDHHAQAVLDALGIAHHFKGIFDIKNAKYVGKPQLLTYINCLNHFNVSGDKAVFFEDMACNLPPAKKLGMQTVLLNVEHEWAQKGSDDPGIDYIIDHLEDFLESLISL